MSAPPVKRKQAINCRRKRRYPDELTARAATAHLIDKGCADRPVLWVYKCDECRGYHTTSKPHPFGRSVTAEDTFGPRKERFIGGKTA